MKTIIDSLPSILTLMIALIAVYIAYQQHQTNKRREKREARQGQLSVYKRVKTLLNSAHTTRTVTDMVYNEFTEAIAEADFLFDGEITDWLSDLQGYANDNIIAESILKDLKEKYDMPAASIADLILEMKMSKEDQENCINCVKDIDQAIDALRNEHDQLKSKFSKYLNL